MGDMVGTAFQLAFVGPIIGAVLAAVAVFCIGYVYNDAMTEVTITLVACYSGAHPVIVRRVQTPSLGIIHGWVR